jgi:hypothetical protein
MTREATLLIFEDTDNPGCVKWNLQINGTKKRPRDEYIASFLVSRNVTDAIAEAYLTARRWGIKITSTEGLE